MEELKMIDDPSAGRDVEIGVAVMDDRADIGRAGQEEERRQIEDDAPLRRP